MRSMSSAFVAAIASRKVKIAELYILELADDTTLRKTTHSKPITWDAGGNVYTPIVAQRDEVNFTTNFESGEVALALSNISSDLSTEVNNDVLERAVLTIKRVRWDASYATDEEFIVFKGFLDIDFNRKVLNVSAKSKFANLAIRIPKYVYEECCNYNLFDNLCDLTRADYPYSGTATAGSRITVTDSNRGSVYKVNFDNGDSTNPVEKGDALVGNNGTPGAGVCVNIVYLTTTTGTIWYVECTHQFVDDEQITGGSNTIVVNGTPAADDTFYELGEIEMTSGDNSGQKRPIALDSAGVLTTLWPFVTAIVATDTYDVYPGCDLRATTCGLKFNHGNIHRSFRHVPRIEDTFM